MIQPEDRWSPLLKNMEDSPGLLVSQEPVKELIAQVRRLERTLQVIRVVTELRHAWKLADAALKEKPSE